jgi:hypothetical protein
VLLALFAGAPELVWLEEPHHGVQFGVDPALDRPGPAGPVPGTPLPAGRTALKRYNVPVRDESGNPTGRVVAVPMRAGAAAGVLDVAALAAALDEARPLAHPRGSAALGLALLQPPARQRFAGSAGERRPGPQP